jgi:DNA-binding NtrC family response regulator
LKRNSPSYVPVVDRMHAAPVRIYSQHAEREQAPIGITDVLTIGEEATVFRPVQRALRATGWAVAHVDNLGAATAWLQSNVAAVAVIEAETSGQNWATIVSGLHDLAGAPEVVVVTSNESPAPDVLRCGAFDELRRPFDDSDLLWAVASAWHIWMTRRERRCGGGACSDA